jgi:hypothetical protein
VEVFIQVERGNETLDKHGHCVIGIGERVLVLVLMPQQQKGGQYIIQALLVPYSLLFAIVR